MQYIRLGAVLPFLFFCAPAWAQDTAIPTPSIVTPPAAEQPAAACCVAPAGTIVELEVVPLLSTKTLKRGDKYEIRLAAPLVVDGQTILPAGIMGLGEVVHSAGGSIGGKPGEMILAARFLQYGDQRIPLKGMKLGAVGRDNSGAVLAATMVTALFMFIPGGEVQVAAGTRANAKLATDLLLPPVAPVDGAGLPAAPAAAAAPATSEASPSS